MRKWKQRLFSLLLCGVMLFSLSLPAAAVETGTETEKYLTWDDARKTLVEKDIPASITQVTTGTTELNGTTTDGWYIVRGNIEISNRVTVTGAVHLILADGYTLDAKEGINVGAGNSLTIYAQSTGEDMGKLTAAGSGDDAGIGGGNGGTITINGGTVNATGNYGAGIGGVGGTITITGGEVTATGNGGAGVGGGSGDDSGGAGGTIAITGGEVTATGIGGAGIGGGKGISGDGGNGGTIAITGGEVTAEGKAGADIGGGKGKGDVVAPSDKIEIIGNATVKGPGGRDLIIGSAEHEAKDEWASDGSSHWHPCKAADCTEHKYDTAPHDFGDWITDTEATSATAGSKHRVCSICQYQETQTIPATGGGSSGGGGSYTPPTKPTYPPALEKPSEGGDTPSIFPSNPKQGDTVTVTPKPDEGYEVDKITVTDRNDRPVEVTKKPDGTYTFRQPSGQVTIEIEYAPVPLIDRPWTSPFSDVAVGDWYYEAVRFVQENGLMNGYSDGRFGPNDSLSRAQLAQILFNKEGRPAVSGGGFNDVDSSAWYAGAVTWAAENGIVGGYGNGTFGPNDSITREQLAVMLWRYSGSPAATDQELHFNDTDEISGFALEAMRWAVENGILNGYGDGKLGPQGQAARAQAAQMLKNFMEAQGKNA